MAYCSANSRYRQHRPFLREVYALMQKYETMAQNICRHPEYFEQVESISNAVANLLESESSDEKVISEIRLSMAQVADYHHRIESGTLLPSDPPPSDHSPRSEVEPVLVHLFCWLILLA
jgi:hypothetical protein